MNEKIKVTGRVLPLSDATRRRNPELFTGAVSSNEIATIRASLPESKPAKRVRQSEKPLMNKLETEWFNRLCVEYSEKIHPQAKTYKIANGLRYTPDFSAIIEGVETVWEVKGKWVDGDSFPKLKMFAHEFPEIKVLLVWKGDDGDWKEQEILP